MYAQVAGFDLDGTLLRWTCVSWPQKLDDYALWSAGVVVRLRALHADGYKIVIFGNRGQVMCMACSNMHPLHVYTCASS